MPDWIFNVLGVAGVAVGVYAGIRVDLARLHERMNSHHDRIERIEGKVFR